MRRLRAPGADFAAIARELSDDEVTAASEGFGGFRSAWNGGDEAAVVEAARALPVGGISDPVSAPLGFHVVQPEALLADALDQVRETSVVEVAHAVRGGVEIHAVDDALE